MQPFVQSKELLPRRRQKHPRVLSYKKCRFCRDPKVKTKCVWNQGPWPNKCERCFEKQLECSQPRQKAEERVESSQVKSAVSNGSQNTGSFDPGPLYEARGPSDTAVTGIICHAEMNATNRLVLQLLPLREMVLMASEALKELSEELLRPLKHDRDWQIHADKAMKRCSTYECLASTLENSISRISRNSEVAMRAALDLAHYSHAWKTPLLSGYSILRRVEIERHTTIQGYIDSGHLGMALVLLIFLLMEIPFEDSSHSIVTENLIPCLIRCHKGFLHEVINTVRISDVVHIQEAGNLHRYFQVPYVSFEEVGNRLLCLEKSQLFMPKELLVHTSIRCHIRAINLNDCLDRSPALIEYDAGVPGMALDIRGANQDYAGRTLLHAACIRGDEPIITTLIAKGLVNDLDYLDCDQPLLQIAAARGDLNIFSILYSYYEQRDNFHELLKAADASLRTFIEWAASCGHHEIIDFYLSHYHFVWDNDENEYSCGRATLSRHATIEAFEKALRFDHLAVIETLTKHLDISTIWDLDKRTPFWWAVYHKRLDAMRILERYCDVDYEDCLGHSPLLEAARIGFTEGVCLLLSLHIDDPPRVDIGRTDKDRKTAGRLAVENGHDDTANLLPI